MRENGAWLTGKNANFGGFAVLRNPIIDPLLCYWRVISFLSDNKINPFFFCRFQQFHLVTGSFGCCSFSRVNSILSTDHRVFLRLWVCYDESIYLRLF